jgi:RNA polymerase sigma factor (sigma-70 family)
MSSADTFAHLLSRVRRGDADATEQFFRQFGPQIRLEVKTRLRDPRLRRRIDESDVCQLVMLSFFVRARLGEYDVANPKELMDLLVGMARNKLAAEARAHSADRRDYRRTEAFCNPDSSPDAEPSPSQIAMVEELLHELRHRLSEEERGIADLRVAGKSWAEVAAELGGTPDGRRVQLYRAARRVAQELGLEVDDD